jgi:hypothetical protein
MASGVPDEGISPEEVDKERLRAALQKRAWTRRGRQLLKNHVSTVPVEGSTRRSTSRIDPHGALENLG